MCLECVVCALTPAKCVEKITNGLAIATLKEGKIMQNPILLDHFCTFCRVSRVGFPLATMTSAWLQNAPERGLE